jgi:Lon protease-like protein
MHVSWLVVGSWWLAVDGSHRFTTNKPATTNRLAATLYLILMLAAIPSPAAAQEKLPDTIPIFPLEDVMLFPEMSVPLHIFEPRYKAMIADALKGNRIIGMVLLRPGYEKDYERSPSVFPVGCAGVINEVEQLPNGEYNIVLGALTKYRITREEASRPYRIAHVTPIADTVAEADRPTLHARRQRLEELIRQSGGRTGVAAAPPNISDERLVNGMSQLAHIDELDRERLLEAPNPLARADVLIAILEKSLAER